MPRKLIKRYLPDPHEVKQNRSLALFGSCLHQANLWHLNRRSASYAVACGLFGAFLPIPGQMIIAGIMAISLQANLPLTIAMVWITNPFTIPPIFYACYRLGCYLLGIEAIGADIEFSLEWIKAEFHDIWQPLVLGSLVSAITASTLGFFLIRLIWRWQVATRWKRRNNEQDT